MKIQYLLLILILIIFAYFNRVNGFNCDIIGSVKKVLIKLRFNSEKFSLTYIKSKFNLWCERLSKKKKFFDPKIHVNNLTDSNSKLNNNKLLPKNANQDNLNHTIYIHRYQRKNEWNDGIEWKLKIHFLNLFDQNISTKTFFTTLVYKNKNYPLENKKIKIAKTNCHYDNILKFINKGITTNTCKLLNSCAQTATNYNPYKLNVSDLQETHFVFFSKILYNI